MPGHLKEQLVHLNTSNVDIKRCSLLFGGVRGYNLNTSNVDIKP